MIASLDRAIPRHPHPRRAVKVGESPFHAGRASVDRSRDRRRDPFDLQGRRTRLEQWGAGTRGPDGLRVVLVPVTGIGSGVSETGPALAGMRVAGVGAMPVGTAGQVDRAKRARRSMP